VIVVDTNVLVYFVLRNDFAASADAVFAKDAEWAAPSLWRSEMRNVLSIYVRRNDLMLVDAIDTMRDSERLIGLNEFPVDSGRVLELSQVSGCTAYDCEFVHLAETLGVPLVTSDGKLLAAFPSIAISMADFAAS
jgi:predicted nucleic acid-binding protein